MLYKADKDHPDRMRKKVLDLREKARVTEMSDYAEQLIRAAEDLENSPTELERRA